MLDPADLQRPEVLNRIAPNQVYVLAVPTLPHFRFEWHPVKRKVYVIRMDIAEGERHVGEPIAENVENHGLAWNLVLVWCRGYRERDREIKTERIVEDVHKWS